MRKFTAVGIILITFAMVISAMPINVSAGGGGPTLTWNGALIWGSDDTYTIPAGATGEDVIVAAAAKYGDGRVIVSSSFEAYGNTYSHYGYGNDLDDLDNKQFLKQGLEWLIGAPDPDTPQKIYFAGWSSYYHSTTISYMTGLGYQVTWGGAFKVYTATTLSGYDMLMTSCQGITVYGPSVDSSIANILTFVGDGGGLWQLGHEGPCFTSCDGASEDKLANNFGIEFNMDRCYDTSSYHYSTAFPVYTNFASHPVTDGLDQVTFHRGTSLTLDLVDPEALIEDLRDNINGLDDDDFKNNADNRKKALNNKLDAVLELIENGEYQEAIDKLTNDIRAKMDGSQGGNPKNDWITDPDVQAEKCEKIDNLIAILQAML